MRILSGRLLEEERNRPDHIQAFFQAEAAKGRRSPAFRTHLLMYRICTENFDDSSPPSVAELKNPEHLDARTKGICEQLITFLGIFIPDWRDRDDPFEAMAKMFRLAKRDSQHIEATRDSAIADCHREVAPKLNEDRLRRDEEQKKNKMIPFPARDPNAPTKPEQSIDHLRGVQGPQRALPDRIIEELVRGEDSGDEGGSGDEEVGEERAKMPQTMSAGVGKPGASKRRKRKPGASKRRR